LVSFFKIGSLVRAAGFKIILIEISSCAKIIMTNYVKDFLKGGISCK